MNFSLESSDRLARFWGELSLLSPEVALALGMCAVLLTPFIGRRDSNTYPLTAAFGSILAAVIASIFTFGRCHSTPASLFHGMLAVDPFSQFFKLLLLCFTALILLQWLLTRDARQQTSTDVVDFLCLILGAAFGMSLMASASNLLMILIATEAASLPSFALAGFRKRSRLATEASLKYVVFGAASSAVSVYGMSLIYGATGSLDLPAIAAVAAKGITPMLAVGLTGLLAGIAFKLSAVPLHFWCPDVFEGASTEVTTFLSVASKGAAVAMLTRVLASFGSAAAVLPEAGNLFTGLAAGVAVLGGITATWGNLVAYHQNNLKRMLAYSSIAHAGYMIMAASMLVLADRSGSSLRSEQIASGLLFYLMIYLFMNLGAFTIVAIVAEKLGSENVEDYAGMGVRSPAIAILLAVCLLSLFGMPGLGGFWAKIFLAAGVVSQGAGGIVLVGVLFLNTLLSFFFYMRPIVTMVLASPGQRPSLTPQSAGVGLVAACCVVLLVTGILPGLADTHAFGGLARPHSLPRQPAPSKPLQGEHQPAAQPAAEAGPVTTHSLAIER